MKNRNKHIHLICGLLLLSFSSAHGQLTAPGSVASEKTSYPVFPENDDLFVFCAAEEDNPIGTLAATTALEGTKTFLWERYNPGTYAFEEFRSESTELRESIVTNLGNGGYRVSVSQGDSTEIYRAWVFNSRITAEAEVTNSNCESFHLSGSFVPSPMIYYDLANQDTVEVIRDIQVEWKTGSTVVARVLKPQIFDPPTRNTDYTLRIYDRFGCETAAGVTYESIVTKAKFSVDPMEGEAPLTVLFTNESENGDPTLYEWFFYRNLDEIKRESEASQEPVDSIMRIASNQNPSYIYEQSGMYLVKLVSKKQTNVDGVNIVCVDTAYMTDFIVVDTSFVSAPNVFTPNNDGVNDQFIVKFWSMQSIKISIYNRWGKRVHFWESSNVRGFDDTYTETVWDGRIGNRYASPGVYYYVIEGRGRDDKKRRQHGFVHLFREK